MFLTLQLTARVEVPDAEFQALTQEQRDRYQAGAADLAAERVKHWFKGRAATITAQAEITPTAAQPAGE